MPRAKSVVAALTVVVLAACIGVLQRTEGADPAAAATDDALPSRALGLSDHRRLARQGDWSGGRAPGHGAPAAGPLRPVTGPLAAARPLRLRVPGLGIDVPVSRSSGTPDGAEGADRTAGQGGHEGRDRQGGRAGQSRRERPGRVSWQAGGPAPGSAGTAVIGGPGLDLAGLRPGRSVEVARDDGRTAVFTVVRISPGASDGREDRAGRPQLRLVGGESAVLARLTGQRRSR
ncbi:class F sortase [Streptomyces subrutilus]|uniref:class F sortase n=1 Tax=Streptomyces subrutilus TaxID=36818 RepID=UPI0033FDB431